MLNSYETESGIHNKAFRRLRYFNSYKPESAIEYPRLGSRNTITLSNAIV